MEELTCMSIFCHKASDYESMFCLHCTLSSKYFSIERFELFKCVFLELSACILQRLTKRLNTVPVFIHNCCKHLNGGHLRLGSLSLSTCHMILGVGDPVAPHTRVTSLPSSTCWSSLDEDGRIRGATVEEDIDYTAVNKKYMHA